MSTLTEEDIESFLTSLRAGDVDKKINLLQLWGIKLEGVTTIPERGIDAITLLVAPFLRSSSHLLVTSTLSGFLPVFLPLIPTTSTEPHLRLALTQLLPGLVEKLNDNKDKVSEPARDLIVTLGSKCYAADQAEQVVASTLSTSKGKAGHDKEGVAAIWENAIKDVLAGRGARAKIGVLKLLLTMREDTTIKLPLKPWLPSLVNLLEDSDGGVRDQARETVVALLSPPAPPAARSELKKLMLARNVRKSISDAILTRVLGAAVPASATPPDAEGAAPRDAGLRSGATTPAEDIPIVYVANARDLESEFKAMLPHFAGKETEHNWGPRERSLLRIRGMLRGKVFTQLPDAFVMGLKGGILDGVGKTLLSLRTTVAQHACALVQELAEVLGPSFDQFVEPLLPTLGKMAGFTKRIIAEKSQKAVAAMIRHSTAYRVLLGYIVASVQDKSTQTKAYGASHLKVFVDVIAKSVASIESTPGAVDQIEDCVRTGLKDVSPHVREQSRAAFWSFNKLWPKRGEALMDSLDPTARKQLEKANAGGNGAASAPTTPSRPALTRPRASAAILAAKRARAAELAAERAAAEQNTDNGFPVDVPPRRVASDGTPTPKTPATPALARLRDIPLDPGSPSPAFPRSIRPAAGGLVPTLPVQNSSELHVEQPAGVAKVTEDVDDPASAAAPAGSETTVLEEASVKPALIQSPPPVQISTPETDSPSVKVERSQGTPATSLADNTIDGHGLSPASVMSISRPSLDESAKSSTESTAARRTSGSSAPRPVTRTPAGMPIKSPAPSNTSSRSRSPSLARTLSRSPPSLMDSVPHQPFRSPGVRPSTASSEASGAVTSLRTPVQQRFPITRTPRSHEPLISTTPYTNSSRGAPSPTTPLGRDLLNRAPIDAADEARRAQVAQGLSAAQQLIDFDDDQMPITAQQPITPARPTRHAQSTPLNPYRTPKNGSRHRVRQVWEDSPKAMTPKVLRQLEGRHTERNWWSQRRDRLEQVRPYEKEALDTSAIQADIASLSAGRPDIVNLRRLADFSEQHKIALAGQPDEDNIAEQRLVWVDDRLFDRVLQGLVEFLEPAQPQEHLEWSLILLWELITNQWTMFETQEDSVLDALFRLRPMSNSVILQATNSIMSLLAEVSDPPFMLSLLHSALDRYLAANPPVATEWVNGEEKATESAGGPVRAAGYSFALNAMGLCILNLPKEAVEVEAKRMQNQVCTAIQERNNTHARQAGYGVVLAIQCILCDDVRTLSLFPRLENGQRSFVTYLMQQRGLLGPTGTPSDAAVRRETVANELVEGLAKRAPIPKH